MNTIMSHKGEKTIIRIFVAKENTVSFIFTKEIASMRLREQGMIIGIIAYQKQSVAKILNSSKEMSLLVLFIMPSDFEPFDSVHLQFIGNFVSIKELLEY